jgi:hypothetical protein
LRSCEGSAYFLSPSQLAEKILPWGTKVIIFPHVPFDIFTVLGVCHTSLDALLGQRLYR